MQEKEKKKKVRGIKKSIVGSEDLFTEVSEVSAIFPVVNWATGKYMQTCTHSLTYSHSHPLTLLPLPLSFLFPPGQWPPTSSAKHQELLEIEANQEKIVNSLSENLPKKVLKKNCLFLKINSDDIDHSYKHSYIFTDCFYCSSTRKPFWSHFSNQKFKNLCLFFACFFKVCLSFNFFFPLLSFLIPFPTHTPLRFLFVFSPSYLHPDEHFQSMEIASSIIFPSPPLPSSPLNQTKEGGWEVGSWGKGGEEEGGGWGGGYEGYYQPWEYDIRSPNRSLFSVSLLSTLPLLSLQFIRWGLSVVWGMVKGRGGGGLPPPSPLLLLVGGRLWCWLLSVVGDGLVMGMARKAGQRGWQMVLITSTSWVCVILVCGGGWCWGLVYFIVFAQSSLFVGHPYPH